MNTDEGMSCEERASAALYRLRERGWTLGIAESLTGGLLASTLIAVPGASVAVLGGIIAYATPLKHTLLGVDPELLAAHGAVHADVARQMAEGVRRAVAVDGRPADVGVATTGIAGPESPDGQPVGTVFVGIASPLGSEVVHLELAGDRDAIRGTTVHRALLMLTALAEGVSERDDQQRKSAAGNTPCCESVTFGDSKPSHSGER